MNCQEFEPTIIKLACGLLIDAAVRDRALDHIDQCESCRARLEAQRRIAGALEWLAEDEAAVAAPDRLGRQLLQAFEDRGRWTSGKIAAGIAAAILLCSLPAIVIWSNREWREIPERTAAVEPAVRDTAKAAEPVESSDLNGSPAPIAPAAKPVGIRNRSRISAASPPAREESDDSGEYVSLRPSIEVEPAEFERIVYMQIPRSTLALWGLPVGSVPDDGDGGKVNAKVIFGEDGVARAIRILNN